MRFWKRVAFVLLAVVAVCLVVRIMLIVDDSDRKGDVQATVAPSYHASVSEGATYNIHPRSVVAMAGGNINNLHCDMGSCFDYSRCEGRFKVYVYPQDKDTKISPTYENILNAVRRSKYYTDDPEEACLLVPSLDTLDRDKLSKDFVHGLPAKIAALPHWNHGTNHLLFNLYSGSWPDYIERVDFRTGNAILAKASLSTASYRPGFDVSLPLFPRTHPERVGNPGAIETHKHTFPLKRPYLAAFKGKRYTFGKGGEVRNSLYHLHNDHDVILLTTCRHGTEWSKYQDFRCSQDNTLYDKYEYDQLLINSSYCLVPRGRRLGSFRFIEALQGSCVPVSLSNGYIPPFSEVIDWSKAAITVDERQLLQVVHMLRGISEDQLLQMRLQTQFLWDAYFSSVETIAYTTLEIIRQRIQPHLSNGRTVWNAAPGGLATRPEFSTHIADFPFYLSPMQRYPSQGYTAVIKATNAPLNSLLVRLIKSIALAPRLRQIVILSSGHQIESSSLPNVPVPIIVLPEATKSPDDYLWWRLDTDGIISLSDDLVLHPEEVEFGFDVWQHHPSRVVGFLSHSHYWDAHSSRWAYSTIADNQYSVILTKPAFLHKYYLFLYDHILPQSAKELQNSHCQELAMNFLISSVTKKAPVKILNKKYNRPDTGKSAVHVKMCMNAFARIFGTMPLRHSLLRMDPSLYKDNVSVVRKQYRKLEAL